MDLFLINHRLYLHKIQKFYCYQHAVSTGDTKARWRQTELRRNLSYFCIILLFIFSPLNTTYSSLNYRDAIVTYVNAFINTSLKEFVKNSSIKSLHLYWHIFANFNCFVFDIMRDHRFPKKKCG